MSFRDPAVGRARSRAVQEAHRRTQGAGIVLAVWSRSSYRRSHRLRGLRRKAPSRGPRPRRPTADRGKVVPGSGEGSPIRTRAVSAQNGAADRAGGLHQVRHNPPEDGHRLCAAYGEKRRAAERRGVLRGPRPGRVLRRQRSRRQAPHRPQAEPRAPEGPGNGWNLHALRQALCPRERNRLRAVQASAPPPRPRAVWTPPARPPLRNLWTAVAPGARSPRRGPAAVARRRHRLPHAHRPHAAPPLHGQAAARAGDRRDMPRGFRSSFRDWAAECTHRPRKLAMNTWRSCAGSAGTRRSPAGALAP